MFYLFNLFLGFIFVYLDFNNIDSCLIKYLTIFNNFLYLLVKSVNKTALLASLFTCIADYFLLFTNNQLGVSRSSRQARGSSYAASPYGCASNCPDSLGSKRSWACRDFVYLRLRCCLFPSRSH